LRRSKLSQRRYRCPQRRVWGQHAKVAVPVGAWRGHQRGDAVDQFQRCKGQLIGLGTALVAGRLAALFGTAVHQFACLFAQPLHGKRWSCAIAQQPLQRSAVVGFDADTSVHREAAVLVGQHVFGVTVLQQAPAHEGAQDAFLKGSLHWGHGIRIDATGWVEIDTRRGERTFAHHCLKDPIHNTDVEVNVLIEAGAKSMDKGDCADVQLCLVCIGRARAMGLRLHALCKGYYGASIMPVEVLRELSSRLPKVGLWNLYGQTEIAPLATILGPADQLRKAGSCGRATINVETRVVTDQMTDVAVGEVGEIVHRSPHLMSGYFKDEARTKASFHGDWFHSGDLATMDDEGYITVVDRKKDMIKTGGENVASREVEEAIYALSAVSEVAVIGLPDAKWVEAVTAIVVLKAGESLSVDQLLAHCQAQLAGFKVPKRVEFVDALPKNPSGKVLKRELREQRTAQ
jgi:hypothetical protein